MKTPQRRGTSNSEISLKANRRKDGRCNPMSPFRNSLGRGTQNAKVGMFNSQHYYGLVYSTLITEIFKINKASQNIFIMLQNHFKWIKVFPTFIHHAKKLAYHNAQYLI